MPQKVKVTTEDGQSVILTLDDQPPSDSGKASDALTVAGAGRLTPIVGTAAEDFATSPTAWKTARNLGQLGGLLGGAWKGGPIGAAAGAWTGGRAGYQLSNMAQRAMSPIATGLEKVAPYAQALNTLGGAQGVGELAQMAEPNRRDIGFLGMGPSSNVPGQQPALLNLLWQKLQRIGQ